MRSKTIYICAALAGCAVFAAALYFQYVEGLAPCKMCIWQRYALASGIAFAALAALSGGVAIGALAALAFVIETGIAFFHAGVEQGWWAGPTTCSGGSLPGAFDPNALQQALSSGPRPPRCDEIPWELFGLSMAGWNVLVSLGLAALCVIAIMRAGQASSSLSQ